MPNLSINLPPLGDIDGDRPIVILGPNGSGKTKLAQQLARAHQTSAIGAQRRTWVDDSLPVQQEQQLRDNVRSQQDRWQTTAWQPTEEINHLLSRLIQDHTTLLTSRNEQAIATGMPFAPVTDTNLMLLQQLWNRLFPNRKLEIGGFFPKVSRLDVVGSTPYRLREMSDGERTVLYMAARVMTSEQFIILVDEPELHMHSRLAVRFWDEAERLRPDCRFVYITHDLNFALSRRDATLLIARDVNNVEKVNVDQLSSSIAAEVLGAATLPFYARRIILFEGESGRGFASDFFTTWFDDDKTFVIPSGGRDSVCSAVSGLQTVGVVSAEIIGLVDRDYYSDSMLDNAPKGVSVLSLHEVESIVCSHGVVAALAGHLGRDAGDTWSSFHSAVRKEFQGGAMSALVAKRVRSRVGDLLDNAFSGAQIVDDVVQTGTNHSDTISAIGLPDKVNAMFAEESERVTDALADGGEDMLRFFPGKHLLNILSGTLGLRDPSELTGLVVRSLSRRSPGNDDSVRELGTRIEKALLSYLPPRRTE